MIYTREMLAPSPSDLYQIDEIPTENAPDVHELVRQGSIPSSIDLPMNDVSNGIESVDDIGSRIHDKFDAIDRFREITGKPLANPEG